MQLQPEMAGKSEEGGARQLQAVVLMNSWETQVYFFNKSIITSHLAAQLQCILYAYL